MPRAELDDAMGTTLVKDRSTLETLTTGEAAA